MKIGFRDIWKLESLGMLRSAGSALKTLNTFILGMFAVFGITLLFFLYFVLRFVFESEPKTEIIQSVNLYFGYYLAASVVVRFMFAGFPALSIHAYRVLPVERASVAKVVFARVLFNKIFIAELLLTGVFGVTVQLYDYREMLWLLLMVWLLGAASIWAFHLKIFAMKLLAGEIHRKKATEFYGFHLLLIGAGAAFFKPGFVTAFLSSAQENNGGYLIGGILLFALLFFCSYKLICLFLRYY